MPKLYQSTDRMSHLICDAPALLQVMCRFGIPLGVGDRSVSEVCIDQGIDPPTFLAVANYMAHGQIPTRERIEHLSIYSLMAYLRSAHAYYLSFQLPTLRRKLLEAINLAEGGEVALLILKFYDEFQAEAERHIRHESETTFCYIDSLLASARPEGYRIAQYARSHTAMDLKLQELKNIIIKYYAAPTEGRYALSSVLIDIFTLETDLHTHCEVEDLILFPAVEFLENALEAEPAESAEPAPDSAEALSARERDVLACVVRGQTNKEIATSLYISVNTVLTHRKNITRKLGIRSVSGLTIYAIIHGIISIEDLKQQQDIEL